MNDTRRPAKGTAGEKTETFTAEERAAMKARAQELKARQSAEEDENSLLAKIAEMPEPDRVLAERIHAIVKTNAPNLAPRLWYGMPAYTKNGKIVCFFKAADKFKARYATFGFEDAANLDEGTMWATAFAVIELTAGDEKRLGALVKRAAG
jgi:uncharacterized protein YdhG (YjbR/CyaY superfamily)